MAFGSNSAKCPVNAVERSPQLALAMPNPGMVTVSPTMYWPASAAAWMTGSWAWPQLDRVSGVLVGEAVGVDVVGQAEGEVVGMDVVGGAVGLVVGNGVEGAVVGELVVGDDVEGAVVGELVASAQQNIKWVAGRPGVTVQPYPDPLRWQAGPLPMCHCPMYDRSQIALALLSM